MSNIYTRNSCAELQSLIIDWERLRKPIHNLLQVSTNKRGDLVKRHVDLKLPNEAFP